MARDGGKPGAARIRKAAFRRASPRRQPDRAGDYVDAIAGLIEDKGEAQAADIALRLKAATTSVVKTLAQLEDLGLLTQESRGSVALTGEGWKLADDARRKRRMVEAFLLALGVSEATARSDSDVMAAQASEETLRAMARFLARKLG